MFAGPRTFFGPSSRPSFAPRVGMMAGVAMQRVKSTGTLPSAICSMSSSPPTRSAPAATACPCRPGLAKTATFTALPGLCGSGAIPRICDRRRGGLQLQQG